MSDAAEIPPRLRGRLPAQTTQPERAPQANGIWGMILFLCSEVTIFGSLFGTYYYLEFRVRHWPPDGIAAPKVTLASISTGILMVTVPLMWAAVRSTRRGGGRGRAIGLVIASLIIQAAFLGLQVAIFRSELMDFSPRGSAYGSIYFTLLAAHDAHVIVGLALDLGVLWNLWRHGIERYWMIGLRGLAFYWYVIDALAVIVLLVTLTPSL
jgi:heme/copper-type cytochrome/quinol oxidase subunit 3